MLTREQVGACRRKATGAAVAFLLQPIVRPRLKKHLLKGAFFVRTPVCLEIKKQHYLEITLFFL